MNEHDGQVEKRPLVHDDLEEKAWRKPVREPSLDARPTGVPHGSPSQVQPDEPQRGDATDPGAGDQAAGGENSQGNGDA